MNDNKLLVLVKRLIKLIKEFKTVVEITPEEFIYKKYTVDIAVFEKELFSHFLILMKHEEFLTKTVNKFWTYSNLHLNAEAIMTLFYVLIFILNEENWSEVKQMLIELQFKNALKVIEYFQIENNIVDITQAACKFFASDYVLEVVVKPILKNAGLIERIIYYVKEDVQAKNTIHKKPLTIPISPKFVIRQVPMVPANSVVEVTPCKVNLNVVKNDYLTVNRNLDKAHKKHRQQAKQLLQFARSNAFNCAKVQKKVIAEKVVHSEPYNIKSRKPPPIRNVVIKSTTASLMREAALVTKNKDSEIQKIEALVQGSFNPEVLETLNLQIRQCNEQNYLQEIERKHLQGLLTYEEAKLAKQNVVQENKLKMEEFKKEREQIIEEIDAWKKEEQEKIKALVEKSQNIEKAARAAEEKVLQNKRMQAKMIEIETKDMLKEAYEKRERELAEKVKLIKELRQLEQVRILQVKEFDPTETSNFGLLCEMSIAELKERLGLLKIQVEEELQRRKSIILHNKKKQQELIDSMKTLVDNNKKTKAKTSTKVLCKLELTPEIIALRERLENLRQCNKVNEIQIGTLSGR